MSYKIKVMAEENIEAPSFRTQTNTCTHTKQNINNSVAVFCFRDPQCKVQLGVYNVNALSLHSHTYVRNEIVILA